LWFSPWIAISQDKGLLRAILDRSLDEKTSSAVGVQSLRSIVLVA